MVLQEDHLLIQQVLTWVIWTLTLTTRVFDAQGLHFAASAENLMDTEPKGGERPADLPPPSRSWPKGGILKAMVVRRVLRKGNFGLYPKRSLHKASRCPFPS